MSEAHLGRQHALIRQKCNEEIKKAVVGCAAVHKSRGQLKNDTDKAISDHLSGHDSSLNCESYLRPVFYLLVGLML